MERFTESATDRKVYVDVDATFEADGHLIPRAIYWKDGSRFEITGVRSCVSATALQCGSFGKRYTVIINDRNSTFLFYEQNTRWDTLSPGRWFVERKE